MSDKITEHLEVAVGKVVADAYISYGGYVNEYRAIPSIYDGLKPSQRRLIYTSIKNKAQKQKCNSLIGETSLLHPHGDESLKNAITQLVNRGTFQGHGNFGYYAMYGESMRAAAPRYTSANLNAKWYSMIRDLMDVVPFKQSEADDRYYEPEYLPLPIPMVLTFGTCGIGVGISTDIPAFNAKSIFEAYKANDPSLLKPAFDIQLDYDKSDLQGLWDNGYGRVVWNFRVYKDYSEDGSDGVYVEGDTFTFTPDWSVLDSWKEQGRIFIRDESAGERGCIFIGRNKGIRAVTQDMIYEEVLRATSSANVIQPHKQIMRLAVHDGTIARYVSMKEWIEFTYTNYKRLFEIYRSKRLTDLNANKLVYTHLRQVAELVFADDAITVEQLMEVVGTDKVTIDSILRKSINTLRRCDTDSELSKIEDGISYYTSLDSEEYISRIMNNL